MSNSAIILPESPLIIKDAVAEIRKTLHTSKCTHQPIYESTKTRLIKTVRFTYTIDQYKSVIITKGFFSF